MIERSHSLPLARQARELGISRGSIYYLPKPLSAADLAIMRRIDELHLEFPFAGSRMLRDLLRQEGAAGVFGADNTAEAAEPAIDVKTLHAKIGELTLVNDFLAGALGKAGLLPSAKR